MDLLADIKRKAEKVPESERPGIPITVTEIFPQP